MNRLSSLAVVGVTTLMLATASFAGSVTGNPLADGWTYAGYSLEEGVYVRGAANYGFDVYSTTNTVTAGSNLHIDDGINSWLVGDTVLGVGGVFNSDTSGLGWDVTGTSVNSLLSHANGPKLQVKFGTADATWYASTLPPSSGDGSGSGSDGGATVQIRTSAYLNISDWSANDGTLLGLANPGHIDRYQGLDVDEYVARLIWTYDEQTGKPATWELLLNTSLLERNFGGPVPQTGFLAIVTVQDTDNAYTDALVSIAAAQVVPLPAAAWAGMALMGGIGAARTFRSRR